MEKFRRKWIADLIPKRVLCVSFISLLLVAVSGPPPDTLRIKELVGGREVAAIPVTRGDLLKVEYTHSIYQVTQSEVFSIGRDSRFYLEKVVFGSYAAALYYDAEPSKGFVFESGHWTVTGDGKNYSVLKYRVSPSTGHVLHIGNQRLDLSNHSKTPGGLMEIWLEQEKRN